MKLQIFVVLLTVVLLSACGEKKEFGAKETIVKESAITVAQALQPVNFDRPIKLNGIVTKVCQTEGCWMAIKDQNNAKIRVTFKDGTFAVPLNSAGKRVSMEGMVVAEVVDGETATLWMSHVDSIVPSSKTDQRVPVFIASSVKFD
jgi:hypothetical protein